MRRWIIRTLVPVYLVLIAGVPTLLSVAIVAFTPSGLLRFSTVLLSPALFCLAYVLVCAMLSRCTRQAIIPGRYPRDLGHRIYGPRRLYALCWTSIYYFTPLYHAVLATPLLKRLTLRLFGYTGSLNVTFYPDTWIRDLPLLAIEEGAYLSNRATIGTNMCLMNGEVLVAPVRVERGAMIGHLAMIGPGARIRASAEIGVGAGIGLHCDIGEGARIGPCTVVHHYASISAKADIGAHCFIGLKAVIGPGIKVPDGLVIPARAIVKTQIAVARHAPYKQPLGTTDVFEQATPGELLSQAPL
jgi:acetyltransferase-like isoleucine patch superfamily enzyme